MSEKDLEEKIPGYAALPMADRDAIITFTFLWSLFEAQLMQTKANASRIAEAVDQWDADGTLGAELYIDELTYFRNRYFQNGDFTFRFEKLNLRKSDMPDLIMAGVSGDADTPRDRVLTVLLIVWRLRNNLFHGAKWAYALQGQLDNFTHANAVLMRTLERHAGLV